MADNSRPAPITKFSDTKEVERMIRKVAVLGAGNGGHAFCAHLAFDGFEVRLYEASQFKRNLEPIQAKGGIEAFGDRCGFAEIGAVSTNIEEVVKGADVIIIPVPAFAQDHMVNECLPYLEEGQILLFSPDNGATIRWYKELKEKGMEKKVTLAGMACLLYLCKLIGPAQIDIAGVKHEMQISTMPARHVGKVVDSLKTMYKGYKLEKNALATTLSNFNHQLHTGPMVLNAGRVESNLDFKFYWEGHTKSITNVVKRVDEEKIEVGKSLGMNLPTIEQLFEEYYKGRYKEDAKDLNEIVTTNLVYRGTIAPTELTSRFVTEDVPYGLVLISSIGKRFDVATPTVDGIIQLASVLNRTDYRKEGMTLERLGLGNMSKEDIEEYLREG
jgi:opine dehydrogenase